MFLPVLRNMSLIFGPCNCGAIGSNLHLRRAESRHPCSLSQDEPLSPSESLMFAVLMLLCLVSSAPTLLFIQLKWHQIFMQCISINCSTSGVKRCLEGGCSLQRRRHDLLHAEREVSTFSRRVKSTSEKRNPAERRWGTALHTATRQQSAADGRMAEKPTVHAPPLPHLLPLFLLLGGLLSCWKRINYI